MMKAALSSIAAMAYIAGAAPATAAITTFATFSAPTSATNVRFVNSGDDGRFYTTTTAVGTAPGAVRVNFNFLSPTLASIGTINADFFMDVTITDTPATSQGVFRLQDVPTGGFSFKTTSAITVGSTTYAAGSNLLTGVFDTGVIFGTGTSGSFSGNTTDGALIFTSDFMIFGVGARDYAMSLSAITPNLSAASGYSLGSFRALSGGSFSADAIPEPETWSLMVVGFGLVGVQVRRRQREGVVVA